MKTILMTALILAPLFMMGQDVLPPEGYEKKMKESKEPILLDVRTPNEFKQGHLKGFENLDFHSSEFQDKIMKMDKSRPVFLYCRSGNRSGQTLAALIKLGHPNVTDLQGGIMAWEKAGKPIEK